MKNVARISLYFMLALQAAVQAEAMGKTEKNRRLHMQAPFWKISQIYFLSIFQSAFQQKFNRFWK